MKEINIKIRLVDNRMATAINAIGFNKDLSGHLEILGILENLKDIQKEKINVIGRGNK